MRLIKAAAVPIFAITLSVYAEKSPEFPELLKTFDGKTVTTAKQWEETRRPEILEWFRKNLYGRAPLGKPEDMTFDVFDVDKNALDGKAIRKQVRIYFKKDSKEPYADILIYLPNDKAGPIPVFVGLNSYGNHVINKDPGIVIGTHPKRKNIKKPKPRGCSSERWPIDAILERGYGLAAMNCAAFDTDQNDGFTNGVCGLFDPIYYPDGRPDDAWSTIAIWSWGLSRAIDYFETDPDIDHKRIATVGLSRLGKASLWCGAQDERVALTISTDSCGQGSALTSVEGGNDTVKHLNKYAPHWFCKNWKKYNDRDKEVPVDQHMLIALVAPRPVYIASASKDPYAYPIRDFLACLNANPAYELYGLKGITTDKIPPANTPIQGGHIGYHIREGKHGMTLFDWNNYLDFADKHCEKEGDEIQTVRTHLEKLLREDLSSADKINRLIKELGDDGKWPDIDYESKNRASWAVCHLHLGRTLDIAKAFKAPEHPLHGDKHLKRAVNLVLSDWVENNYRNSNWWYGSIGVPRLLGQICVLMESDIDPGVLDILQQRHLSRTRVKGKGQNKVWTARCVLYGALLKRDHALTNYTAECIKSLISQTDKEGLQYDWSFHLHGPQNQIGTYGYEFYRDIANLAYIFRNTSMEFNTQQLEIIRDFLLKGQSWVAWKGWLDINCQGRGIARNTDRFRRNYLVPATELMKNVDPGHAHEYSKYIKRNTDGPNDLIGNKHFWRSDLMVHRAKDWYASTRMCSKRTIGAESCNNENTQGYFSADGVLMLYRTGCEYHEIFPVWDWRRLPGLTCVQAGPPPAMPARVHGTTDFVGGVSDGKTGLAALDYNRDGLKAKKAWFFLEDAIACLGTDIKSDEKHPVTTSVNQCLLKSDVKEGPDWYWHDSIGYYIPSSQNSTMKNEAQKGNWHLVSQLEALTSEEVTEEVFSLWINHGTRPRDAKYSYVIFPGITADEMSRRVKENSMAVLQNDEDIQSVYDSEKKQFMVAFWKAGKLDISDDKTLKADKPCLIILQEANDTPLLHVSDPTQRLEKINIELTGFKPLSLELPTGPYSGNSLKSQFTAL